MITVIDTNAAVEFALGRPENKPVALALKSSEWVVAPSLYLYEIANVFWKYHRTGLMDKELMSKKTVQCTMLIDEYLSARELYEEALDLSCQIDHPVYDAVYLAACLKKKASLLTLDRRLRTAAEKLKIKILPDGS